MVCQNPSGSAASEPSTDTRLLYSSIAHFLFGRVYTFTRGVYASFARYDTYICGHAFLLTSSPRTAFYTTFALRSKLRGEAPVPRASYCTRYLLDSASMHLPRFVAKRYGRSRRWLYLRPTCATQACQCCSQRADNRTPHNVALQACSLLDWPQFASTPSRSDAERDLKDAWHAAFLP